MIHWLLVGLVVYACTLVLVAIVCTPYLRRRNAHRDHTQRSRRCQRCGHLVEGYTSDELDYKEQLHLQIAHAPPVAQQLVEAA
jgi:hypothetical protein